jgi:NADH dehydrogenase
VAILVTGAGGLVGKAAVAALAEQGIEHVRAVLRDPAASGDLRRHGAKVAVMDATDPDGMEAALTGVFTAVSLTGSLWAEPGAGAGPPQRASTAAAVLEPARVLVAAARRVGVRRLVVLSPARPGGSSRNPWLQAKAEVEELVAGSGLEYAVLRCTHVVGPGSRLAERLRGPGPVAVPGSGGQRVAPVWVGDVARAIAIADDHPGPLHVTWALAGPGSTTFDGFVDALNQATVAKLHLDGDPDAVRRAGLSPVQAEVLAADSLPDPGVPPAPGVTPLPLPEAVARSRPAPR